MAVNKPARTAGTQEGSTPEFLARGGEMGAQMRAYDWAASPLGPPASWPQSLRTVIRIMLTSRYAMWMAWGPSLTFFCNDAYKPTLGVKGNWALGSPSEKVWKEIWPDIGPRIDHVLATGDATWDEGLLLFLERSGYAEETYHTFSYSPLADDAGAITGMLCVVTEETERVIGERRLAVLSDLGRRLAETRVQAEVIAAIESCLAAASRDLPFTLIYLFDNDGTARLVSTTGVDRAHAAAPVELDTAAPDAAWPIASILATGAAVKVADLQRRFADLPTGPWDRSPSGALILPIAQQGQERPAGALIAGLNPYRTLDETYRSFIDLFVGQIAAGIGNARFYEEERKRAEALAEIDRAKTAFFSNVSHEFRTPLTLMLGPLEEILATPDDKEPIRERALIDTAHRNGLRLLKLVNSLLDFSRIEAGRVQARYEPTDLSALTAELASSFRSAIDKAGLRLVIDCAALTEPVHVDRDMWEKIVLNLLSNAFKFTFEGEIGVELRPSPDGAAAELTIRDTGTGIPAQELPLLFERFHRIEGAKGRTFEGSGIGLALVQELVKLHGGSIGAVSELGRGSAFTVAVPRGTAHLPAARTGSGHASALTGVRAQAYVEEALRWLPNQAGEDRATQAPSRSTTEDLGATPSVFSAAGSRVLLADDNADMRDYVRRVLVDRGYEVEAVSDGEAAFAAARRRAPDLVLSDVMMPRLDGFGLLRAIRADPNLRETPVLLLSARAGEEARVEGMNADADDYLTKPFSTRELLARIGANLQMARVRREAAEALRARTDELETVLGTVPAAVWFTRDPDARHVSGNRQAAALLRLSETANASLSAPAEERPTFRVFRGGVEAAPETLPIDRAARGEEVRGDELEIRFEDGTSVTVLVHAAPLHDDARRTVGAVCAAIDITTRKDAELLQVHLNDVLEQRVAAEMKRREQAEAALRQAQKMEAIGQLTGGIAHDFNNLLLVIQGNIEALDRHIPMEGRDGGRVGRSVHTALRGVERAAALTHRLLAFARQQPLDPKPLGPNKLVAGMSDLLRRTLGEAVAIETVLAGGLWRISADANQLENAIINLAVNARDAMPEGGKLTIETANMHLDESYAGTPHEVDPGQYVMIAMSDTGTGMSKEAVEKAFEPFFTTKDIGKGTGLGLSQVYGFVKQSGGHVKIYSEPGEGTTVRLYLPRYLSTENEVDAEAEAATVPTATRSETILVVEDDDDVRAHSTESLRDLGYRVVEAADGIGALRLLEREPSVGLLFTDVGLPGGMNGRQLADEARRRWPRLKVLFTTGYARNAIVHHGRLDRGVELIVKPFTYAALASKVRGVLDTKA